MAFPNTARGKSIAAVMRCDGWLGGPALREIMSWLSSADTAEPQQDRIRDRGSEDQGQAERQRVQLPYRPRMFTAASRCSIPPHDKGPNSQARTRTGIR